MKEAECLFGVDIAWIDTGNRSRRVRGGGCGPVGSCHGVNRSPSCIEHAQKRCPMVKPVKRQVAGEVEVTEMKVGYTGIGTHLKWVMSRSQETRDLAGKLHDVVHHMRQGDECRKAFSLVQGCAQACAK